MRLNFLGGIIAVLLVAALIIAYSSLFTVNQTQQALVLRLGSPLPPITEPGLHVKAPFIDSVVYIDKRILDLEAPSQEVIASDQKRLVVDAFARYRIKDPLRFYQTLGSISGANSQLSILLNSALRRVLGEVTFTHVVRDQRADLMSRIRELVDREATIYGVQVVDVRIRRADLPEQNSQAVYQRMQTERQREAADFLGTLDRKSTRLNSSHLGISYAVFCLKKKKKNKKRNSNNKRTKSTSSIRKTSSKEKVPDWIRLTTLRATTKQQQPNDTTSQI